MKIVSGLACLLLACSVGCGQQDKTPVAAENPAPTAPAGPVQPSAAAQVPSQPKGVATPSEDTGTVDEETPVQVSGEAARDAENLRLASALAPTAKPAAEGRWKEGVHYQRLTPAQPTGVPPGKVEVVEVFWYGCPHCYSLDPVLESWNAKKAPYIQFTRLPVVWGPVHQAHARLFYALAALGRSDLHTAVFRETQGAGNRLASADPAEVERLQTAFAKQQGIQEEDFRKAYRSAEVDVQVQHALDLTRRYRVEGVPLVVINGKYTADVGSAGGQQLLIELIGDLAAREHRK